MFSRRAEPCAGSPAASAGSRLGSAQRCTTSLPTSINSRPLPAAWPLRVLLRGRTARVLRALCCVVSS